MTHERDMERLLDTWFSDGPSEAPDRILDVVADRIGRQSQRPAWRLHWRDIHVNGSLKPLAAIAAIMLVAVGGFVFVERPFDKNKVGATPAPTVAPAPTTPAASSAPASAQPSAGATTWWNPGGGSCSPCLGDLPAGTHATTAFRPKLTYTIPAGWINSVDSWNSYVFLPDVPGNRTFWQTGWGSHTELDLDRNVSVAADDCSDINQAGVGLKAADIANALATRPGLDTSKPVDVTIGGLTGKQVDVAMTSDWTKTCGGYTSVPLIKFPYEGAQWFVVPGEHFRLIVLDVPASAGGGTVLVTAYSRDAAAFADFVATAMPIVNSFNFDLTVP
jgi:hypothetical protein